MKIEEDCFYERMRKEVMLRPEDALVKQEGYERHSKGENIDESAVKVGLLLVSNIIIQIFRLSNTTTIKLTPALGERHTIFT